ncbi:MAG: hypothetical protein ACK5P7_09340 [Bdellovibrio sp.]
MEKLSSILPSNPRIKNVDMNGAQPIRPGIATYGRPVGVNPIKDRFSVSQQAKDIAFKDTLAATNPREADSVKIVDDLSKRFFESRVGEDIKSRPASEETQERTTEVDEMVPVKAAPISSKTAAPLPSGENLNLEA